MTFLDQITVLILTFNEEANIGRTLEGVSWAKRIVVVDSGSTDRTHEIVTGCPCAEIVVRPFDSFAEQCNFGLEQIRTPWVLSLDADYEVSSELSEEIARLVPSEGVAGFRAYFTYCVLGQSLRGTLYPPRIVLYRRDGAKYRNAGHGHRVEIDGKVETLAGVIRHDDRKSISRWLESQMKYAKLEADHLLSTPRRQLRRSDRVRRLGWPAPFLVFLYTLIVKRCILDGRAGWYYVLQRTLAETLIALQIVDRRLRANLAVGKSTASVREPPPLER